MILDETKKGTIESQDELIKLGLLAGDSSTINEIGLFGFWYWLAGVQDTYMLCRDVIGGGVSYVAGTHL